MKNRTLTLMLLLLLGIAGCIKSISPADAYTTDVEQARKWFVGQWTLTKVSAQVTNPSVPDVQLIVGRDSQITVIENGVQIDKVSFETIQTPYSLQLKTNAQPKANNGYVRDPSLQIAPDRLFLDRGMAVDLPGYEFRRVK